MTNYQITEQYLYSLPNECNVLHAHFECGRSFVQARVGSNQRLDSCVVDRGLKLWSGQTKD